MVLMTALKIFQLNGATLIHKARHINKKQETKFDMICFNKIVTKKILSYWHLLFNLLNYTINNL